MPAQGQDINDQLVKYLLLYILGVGDHWIGLGDYSGNKPCLATCPNIGVCCDLFASLLSVSSHGDKYYHGTRGYGSPSGWSHTRIGGVLLRLLSGLPSGKAHSGWARTKSTGKGTRNSP